MSELTAREQRRLDAKVQKAREREAERKANHVYHSGRWAVRCYNGDRCYSGFRHWFRWSAKRTLFMFVASSRGSRYELVKVGAAA